MEIRKTILAVLLCCAMGANAQIKVNNNGYVGIRQTSPQYSLDIKPSSGKIRLDDWTDVFIDWTGSCGAPTIYPEKDWYLQFGKLGQRVGTFYVQTIHVNKTYTDSDSTFKCDFQNLTAEQEKFKKLKPYKYHFTKDFVSKMPEKEQKKFNHEHFGFKAQDVEKIYPELTYKDDSTGKYSIDYTGFIPILVEMVQDLQDLTETQNKKIKELENLLKMAIEGSSNNSKGKQKKAASAPTTKQQHQLVESNAASETSDLETSNEVDVAFSAYLFQNTPNPFSRETEIKYYVPQNTENAFLYVFSLQGNMLLTKQISQLGNGSITISASELQPGMYIYTLAVDGQEADSKRMIITEE
ncbi:MAG: tail fiber domain-containing protein [Salinivirgaceae bacterium]|nr:tail fiber domain-containing protein [Salinivirgaceae bacterium]